MIFWLLGISGAGKTTLGRRLKSKLDSVGESCYLIDGDEVRSFFDHDLGYSEEDRRLNVKRVILSAYLLSKNGIKVIVCNISPYEDLRNLIRRKSEHYNQIFLKKNIEISALDDVKGVYKNNDSNIIGKDLIFDEPLQNELVIYPDEETEDESFSRLWGLVERKIGK